MMFTEGEIVGDVVMFTNGEYDGEYDGKGVCLTVGPLVGLLVKAGIAPAGETVLGESIVYLLGLADGL